MHAETAGAETAVKILQDNKTVRISTKTESFWDAQNAKHFGGARIEGSVPAENQRFSCMILLLVLKNGFRIEAQSKTKIRTHENVKNKSGTPSAAFFISNFNGRFEFGISILAAAGFLHMPRLADCRMLIVLTAK